METHNKSGGKKCYTMCINCLRGGKKVVHYAKSKTNEQQKRKEDASKKTAEADKRGNNNEFYAFHLTIKI